MAKELTKRLTPQEQARKNSLVRHIQKNADSVLVDLFTLYSEDLWREHRTFAAFVQEEIGVEKSRAYQLIKQMEVRERLSTVVENSELPLPTNERQIRPLTAVPAEEQAEVWQEAVAEAEKRSQPVTAALVEEVVKDHLGKPGEEPEPDDEEVDEVPTTLARHSGGKNGQQKRDPRMFESLMSHLGAGLRKIDALQKLIPADKFHRQALMHVKDAMETIQAWKKATR